MKIREKGKSVIYEAIRFEAKGKVPEGMVVEDSRYFIDGREIFPGDVLMKSPNKLSYVPVPFEWEEVTPKVSKEEPSGSE